MNQEVLEELAKIPQKSIPPDVNITPPLKLWKGEGCSHCDQTGYRGRIGIIEILQVSEEMQKIVAEGKSNDDKLVTAEFQRQGMLNMKQDGIVKALKGLTTIEEVFSATKN